MQFATDRLDLKTAIAERAGRCTEMRVAGLDLAKARDYSALVVLTIGPDRLVVERALRLPHVDYREQVDAMTPLLSQMRLIAYDHGGVGAAVGELLPEDAVPVTIVSGDHVSQHGVGWHIGKQRLIGDVLHLSRAGRLMVPPECPGAALLRAELQDFIVVPSRRGVKLHARGRGTDDLVLACALAVVAARLARHGATT